MKRNYFILVTAALLFGCASCGNSNKSAMNQTEETTVVKAPDFDADSAYNYVQAQVDFGPRVPNTKQHVACGEYLAKKLASTGAKVIDQYADLTAYDGTILKSRNIIGSFNPETKKRVLLFAHWDTRPWADQDKDESKHHTPILGANDGASGIGVLLEIARQLGKKAPSIGVDIIFFDAEDYGTPEFYKGEHKEESWCLGTQYWANNPHVEGYNARFGILLDMVGGKGATFYKEAYSSEFAKSTVKKVWDKANSMGYASYFINQDGGYVTDDHLFVNRIAKIPSIDIIPTDLSTPDGGFGYFWHTTDDNMSNIDRSTLKAVGQTVLEVVYNEK
ncbi:Peptidase family M28 [Bacteroides luti]|uniref:Peptidase family M28 n=1 Tax=Bacteroides luti TaxID=1297750 RepID=A0A1M4YTM7_9BACE|nr:M28 family peptidase [Bacteroides luti]SHF08917.1 Peptidase family M28 [Bacteroides luti]